MKKEIKIRQKRIFVFFLIAALLWDGVSPVTMYAANYNNNVSDASRIIENQILAVGDTIEIDSKTQGATGQTFKISYYDWGGDETELNVIEVTSGETHTVEAYTGSSLTSDAFGGWQVKNVYSSGGYIATVALHAVKQYGITYVLDGGTNAETNPSAYVEGVGVESFADASKTGYAFEGWYSDSAFSNQVTSISDTEASDVTLYAKFTPNIYKITYELNGGTNASENPDTYTYGAGVTSLGNASKIGYTFEGWYSNKSEDGVQITGISTTQTEDITLYAKFTANNYKISYELDGGTNASENPTGYTYGTGVAAFENASKTGHTFEGWYTDSGFTKKVTSIGDTDLGDITLYAKFTVNDYTITYVLDGGTNASENPSSYTYGTGVASFENAAKTGYTFEGWYSDPEYKVKIENISETQAENITLYAKFTADNYKITYELDGGTNASENPSSYTYGKGVASFSNAEKPGHTFEGWYSDADFTVKVTSISATEMKNITLYAKFTANKYTITYVLDGGTNASGNPTDYTYGIGVSEFEAASKLGYTFEGWYADETFTKKVTSIGKTESEKVTLYAKFTADIYAITYELDGGTNASENPANYTYGVGTADLEAASKTGHTFEGWYADDTFKTKVTSISKTELGSITLYAKFTANTYKITYELDGGTNAGGNPGSYTYGVGVTTLGDASKTGYTFAGWYADAEYSLKVESIGKTQTEDITLYAKFTANNYKITYELNGGTNAQTNPSVYTYGAGIADLKAASKNGYTFVGWYADADFTTQVTSISKTDLGDITLYAKFTVNTYKITYELDGGTNAGGNPDSYTYGVGVTSLADASKTGYTFVGWYADAEYSIKVESIGKAQTEDITLYAKFTANNYKITYELDGGTNASENPANYTYGVGTGEIEAPSKTGYTFEGWYADAEYSIKVESISKAQTEDITLYARFTVNNYTITYELDGGTNASENPNSYTYGKGAAYFADAKKPGHTFEGWYTDVDFTEKVTSISETETGNITLYAKFTQNTSNSETDTPEIDTPETDTPADENPAEEETIVIAEGGTVSLEAGVAYELGSGTWKVAGDDTVYTGGITFYVSEDAEYEFIKQ